MNTPGENIKKKRLFEGKHLKRVSIQVQQKNNPDAIVTGYALSHEILANQISFFTAQKFPIDEELLITFTIEGEKKTVSVKLNQMHEQISSGRVMIGLPDESNPFPARKFYRCYTKVTSALQQEQPAPTESTQPEQAAPADQPQAA